jgi:hypothetical protein
VLPNTNYLPTFSPKAAEISPVTSAVSFDLLSPEVLEFGTPAWVAVTMPKITIHEHSELLFRKHEVRASSKRLHIAKKVVSLLAQIIRNKPFDIGAFLTDLGHEQATLPTGEAVHRFVLLDAIY